MPRRINWSDQEVLGLCQSWKTVLEAQEGYISPKGLARLASEHYHKNFGHNFDRDEKAAFTKLRKLQRFIEFIVSFNKGDDENYKKYYRLDITLRKKLLKDQFYRVDEIPEASFLPIFNVIKQKMEQHLLPDIDSNSTSRNENSLPELLEGAHSFENSLTFKCDSDSFDLLSRNLRQPLYPKQSFSSLPQNQFDFENTSNQSRLRKLDALEPPYDPVVSPKTLKMRRLENFGFENDSPSNSNDPTSSRIKLNPNSQSQMLKGVLEEHFKQLEHVFEQSNRKLLENIDKIFEL